MKLFEDHSPTMGEVEGFGDHIPSGIVEALTVFPTWDTRSSGFNPARPQLPNLKHLGLVGASLEGHMEGAAVPLHHLHFIENYRDAGPRSGVRRLAKRLEIYSCKLDDLDNKCRFTMLLTQ